MPRGKIRVQIDMTKDAVKRLDQLVEDTESASRSETIRAALHIYEYLHNKTKKENCAIHMVTEDGSTVVDVIF